MFLNVFESILLPGRSGNVGALTRELSTGVHFKSYMTMIPNV